MILAFSYSELVVKSAYRRLIGISALVCTPGSLRRGGSWLNVLVVYDSDVAIVSGYEGALEMFFFSIVKIRSIFRSNY